MKDQDMLKAQTLAVKALESHRFLEHIHLVPASYRTKTYREHRSNPNENVNYLTPKQECSQ